MGKYQVLENKLNARGDKRSVKVAVSPEESIYLNLSAVPTEEQIDAHVDLFLAQREAESARMKAEDAERRLREL